MGVRGTLGVLARWSKRYEVADCSGKWAQKRLVSKFELGVGVPVRADCSYVCRSEAERKVRESKERKSLTYRSGSSGHLLLQTRANRMKCRRPMFVTPPVEDDSYPQQHILSLKPRYMHRQNFRLLTQQRHPSITGNTMLLDGLSPLDAGNMIYMNLYQTPPTPTHTPTLPHSF